MTDITDLHEPGDDREPEPPDEHEPLNLDELAATLTDAQGDPEPGAATAEVLASVPHLLTELRAARERLAQWQAMPIETYRYVVAGERDPDEHPLTEEASAERAIAESMSWPDSRPLRRAVYLGPWEDLLPFSDEAPF
ncbi:hypothetical protein OG884_15710 [Streptosporangium sp. NBC_01755]|uniref:hypothetical protein n=1 Tax=Streptosporangium sp. NBC_01755 TaxID=2975949 RepID=UPI002DDA1659|nr:hypothetical protein [Streptosporangium sp. NBC_01755]WSD03280.1 hypothetical protein OG884_15710 [Streptosporangium sp. NBC_01755]